MKIIQNLVVGFVVSFVGSIPLGYLNVVGYQIYRKSNLESLIFYLFGVLLIEGFVIYGTLIFAKKLSENRKLLKLISLFSIFFMLILATIFYFQLNDTAQNSSQNSVLNHLPFITGIVVSSLNFIQIPFWIGWNLYLLDNNYIATGKILNVLYLIGTVVGTFCGMLTFVIALNLVGQQDNWIMSKILSFGIPSFFLVMAVIQTFKFYKKYS